MKAHADPKGNINRKDLKEYFSGLFEHLGVPVKPEELSLLSHQIIGITSNNQHVPRPGADKNEESGYSTSYVTDRTTSTIAKIAAYCTEEASRTQWGVLARKFRRLMAKVQLMKAKSPEDRSNARSIKDLFEGKVDATTGCVKSAEMYDILHDYLVDYMSANNAKVAEGESSRWLTAADLTSVIKQFVVRIDGDSNPTAKDVENVSLAEFMTFLGENGSVHSTVHSNKEDAINGGVDDGSKGDHKEEEGKHQDHQDRESDKEEDAADGNDFVSKPYSFSAVAEIESVERKIRQVARLAAANGVDVEKLFLKFDKFQTGNIRTTEFMEILTILGMYILENSKVTDSIGNDSNDNDDVKKSQLSQISNLRKNYASNAVSSAKKLVSEQGANQLRRSDFKVFCFYMRPFYISIIVFPYRSIWSRWRWWGCIARVRRSNCCRRCCPTL